MVIDIAFDFKKRKQILLIMRLLEHGTVSQTRRFQRMYVLQKWADTFEIKNKLVITILLQ